MANKRQQYLDAIALERWREVLPGVPDDQIVLPRYTARGYGFPLPPHFTNDPEVWENAVSTAEMFASMCGVRAREFKGAKSRDVATGSFAMKQLKTAMRWWRTLRKKTVLSVQQQLYSRNDYWKDIFDIHEFLACKLIALVWLNLPPGRQSSSDVEKAAIRLIEAAAVRNADDLARRFPDGVP